MKKKPQFSLHEFRRTMLGFFQEILRHRSLLFLTEVLIKNIDFFCLAHFYILYTKQFIVQIYRFNVQNFISMCLY